MNQTTATSEVFDEILMSSLKKKQKCLANHQWKMTIDDYDERAQCC